MDKYQALDSQLYAIADSCADAIPVLSSTHLDKRRLASSLGKEIAELLSFALTEWNELAEELNSPVAVNDRHDMLIGYYWLNERGDIGDPILDRARIVTQFYFDLMYFRDKVFILIRDRLGESHKSKLPNLCEWLRLFNEKDEYGDRLRIRRNSFAHGTWIFLHDFSGIICYDKRDPHRPYLWTQGDLDVAHKLLYCLQCVFFEEAKSAMSSKLNP